jgi:hypothetical protein
MHACDCTFAICCATTSVFDLFPLSISSNPPIHPPLPPPTQEARDDQSSLALLQIFSWHKYLAMHPNAVTPHTRTHTHTHTHTYTHTHTQPQPSPPCVVWCFAQQRHLDDRYVRRRQRCHAGRGASERSRNSHSQDYWINRRRRAWETKGTARQALGQIEQERWDRASLPTVL